MFRNPFALSLIPLLAACVGDVGEGKVAAEIQDAPAGERAAAPTQGAALPIDASRSSVTALGAKVTATHPIVFHRWSGTARVDGDRLVDLDFAIDVASLESDSARLTGHLKNEDFLWVDQHPKATFDAAEIVPAPSGAWTHKVSGDLTIRGQTRRVSFPATIAVTDADVQARTEFTIDRQDFGISYPGKADDLVQDNVVLTVAFVAPRRG